MLRFPKTKQKGKNFPIRMGIFCVSMRTSVTGEKPVVICGFFATAMEVCNITEDVTYKPCHVGRRLELGFLY